MGSICIEGRIFGWETAFGYSHHRGVRSRSRARKLYRGLVYRIKVMPHGVLLHRSYDLLSCVCTNGLYKATLRTALPVTIYHSSLSDMRDLGRQVPMACGDCLFPSTGFNGR